MPSPAVHTATTPADPPYWMATPSKPRLKLPPGATDAHVHVFGPRARFPFADGRNYTPSDATKEMLFSLHERLGIQHCVIVQPNCHGRDNAVTVDAVTATGQSYRGIALVAPDVAAAELKRLDTAGLRGARFHYMEHLSKGPGIDEVMVFAKRLADIGWHLQIHMAGELIPQLAPKLKLSPVPVVIDHIGRVDAGLGLEQPGFRALLALMAEKHVWVKVSGTDRITRQGPPYADAVPFARKLVAELGDRCVWGTDWPHPNHTHVPDDGMLVDILSEIAPGAALKALLVDNPQRLYQFAPARKLTGA
ncbi:MAG: amidohydrolase family protein [Pseudolabrys sp.]